MNMFKQATKFRGTRLPALPTTPAITIPQYNDPLFGPDESADYNFTVMAHERADPKRTKINTVRNTRPPIITGIVVSPRGIHRSISADTHRRMGHVPCGAPTCPPLD